MESRVFYGLQVKIRSLYRLCGTSKILHQNHKKPHLIWGSHVISYRIMVLQGSPTSYEELVKSSKVTKVCKAWRRYQTWELSQNKFPFRNNSCNWTTDIHYKENTLLQRFLWRFLVLQNWAIFSKKPPLQPLLKVAEVLVEILADISYN